MNRICLALLLTLSACAHASFDAPREFVVLDEDSAYAKRATSAEGVVIAVRELEAPKDTSLVFWSEAIRQRLQSGQGYALLGAGDVRAKSGEAGKLLKFGHDQNGRTFDYWVAVFASEKRVVVLEMGGRREPFDRQKPALERALSSLTLR